MLKRTLVATLGSVFLLAGVLSGIPALADSPEDILIVANKGAEVNQVTPEEVRSYFLKTRTHWKSGGKVVPVNIKDDPKLRAQFQQLVLQMTPEQEKHHWTEQGIRKGLQPPPEFKKPLRAVFKIKAAIGYVFRKDFTEGVAKILLVVPSNAAP